MAIITHPDGYLQITEGHRWQDVSDSGILQRIFRGWNERRLVSGLPLYWYGRNSRAAMLGGDAQFTEFENPLTVPNPTYTIDDARIYPGAVLQNAVFWNFLINELSSNILYNPENIVWMKYQFNGNYTGQFVEQIDYNAVISVLNDKRVSLGDVLGIKQINALLYAMSFLQFYAAYGLIGTVGSTSKIYSGAELSASEGFGLGYVNCQDFYSKAKNDWYSSRQQYGQSFYSFDCEALGESYQNGSYLFINRSFFSSTSLNQKAIPLNGEFILIAYAYNLFDYDYVDLSGKTPSPGDWTIERKILNKDFTLPLNYLGFDVTKSPLELCGVNCNNFRRVSYSVIVFTYAKPKFADLP